MHHNALPDDLVPGITELRARGASLKTVAKHYGVVARTVKSFLIRHGLPLTLPHQSQKLEDKLPEIRAKYAAGATLTALHHEYAADTATLKKLFRLRGIPIRTEWVRNAGSRVVVSAVDAVKAKECVEAYARGETLSELAVRLGGCSIASVRKIITSHGATLRRPGPVSAAPEVRLRHERDNALQRNYGVTVDDYDKMLAVQSGKCAICACTDDSRRNRGNKFFAVDHCHTTGLVRGLLCANCNQAIGLMHERVAWLLDAGAYLEKYQAVSGQTASAVATQQEAAFLRKPAEEEVSHAT